MGRKSPKKPMPLDLQVARNIRQLRIAKQISQQAMGKSLGITYQQYQKIESGKNRITIGRFVQIAKILEVTSQILLDEDVPPIVLNA